MTLTNYKVNIPNKPFKKWIVAFEKSRVRLHSSRFWLKENWLRELFTTLFRWNLNVCCVIVHLFSELCTLVLHVLKPNISPCYISLYHYNIMWRYLQTISVVTVALTLMFQTSSMAIWEGQERIRRKPCYAQGVPAHRAAIFRSP